MYLLTLVFFVFRSIYASSRAATEINGFESKLESLKSIRQTLITGENISPTNLDQMSRQHFQEKKKEKKKDIKKYIHYC